MLDGRRRRDGHAIELRMPCWAIRAFRAAQSSGVAVDFPGRRRGLGPVARWTREGMHLVPTGTAAKLE